MTSPELLKRIQDNIKKTNDSVDTVPISHTTDSPPPRSLIIGAALGVKSTGNEARVEPANSQWKATVEYATTGPVVGGLTGSKNVDGITLSNDTRVLVKDEDSGSRNGIYIVNTSGAWTRATDADTSEKIDHMAVFVRRGPTNADTAWICTTDNPNLGTTVLRFVQFGGAGNTRAGRLEELRYGGDADANKIFTPATPEGVAANITFPDGMEQKGLGSLFFNTANQSLIGIHDSEEIVKYLPSTLTDDDDENDFVISSSQQKVFQTQLQDTRALALSRPLYKRRQPDGSLGAALVRSTTLELFSAEEPTLNLVATGVDPTPDTIPTRFGRIGDIGFDVKFDDNGVTYQKTMAWIQAGMDYDVRKASINAVAYNGSAEYMDGDIVSRGSPVKYYRAIRQVPRGATNFGPPNTRYWTEVSRFTANSGRLDFNLREIDTANPVGGTDVFHGMMRLNESGIDFNDNTLTKVGAIGFTDFATTAPWIYPFADVLEMSAGLNHTVRLSTTPSDPVADFDTNKVKLEKQVYMKKTAVPTETIPSTHASLFFDTAGVLKQKVGTTVTTISTGESETVSTASIVHVPALDFPVGNTVTQIRGMTYSDGFVYVVNGGSDNHVYAYNTSGTEQTERDFDLYSHATEPDNQSPEGIAYDTSGRRLYVVDRASNLIFRYTRTSQLQTPHITLDSMNGASSGITYYDGHLYVSDSGANKVFAYSKTGSGGQSVTSREINDLGFTPRGITNNGTHFFILDAARKIHIYTVAGSFVRTVDNVVPTASTDPTGILINGTTIYTTDAATDNLNVYGYTYTPADDSAPDSDDELDLTAVTTNIIPTSSTLNLGANTATGRWNFLYARNVDINIDLRLASSSLVRGNLIPNNQTPKRNLGSSSHKWGDVYGVAGKFDTLTVNGVSITGSSEGGGEGGGTASLTASTVTGLDALGDNTVDAANDLLILLDTSTSPNTLRKVSPNQLGLSSGGGGTGSDLFRSLKFDYTFSNPEATPTLMYSPRSGSDATNNYVEQKFIFPPDIELRRIGKIFFETTLNDSVIAGNGTLVTRYIQDGTDRTLQTRFEHVMGFDINGGKAMALSSLSAGQTDSTPTDSVVEIFGIRKPLLKLVEIQNRTTFSSTNEIDIGSIYFDARIPNTSSSTVNYDQVTFAEIKAQAETGRTSYTAWNSSGTYPRGSRVSFGGKTWLCVVATTGAEGEPNSAANSSSWREFSSTGLRTGKMQFVLRDTNRTTLGTNDDEFHEILTLDHDDGVYVDSHLTTHQDSFVNLNGHVFLGLNTGDVDVAGPIRLHNAHTPTSPSAGMIWYDGTNFKYHEGSTTKTFSSTVGTLTTESVTGLTELGQNTIDPATDLLMIVDGDTLRKVTPNQLGIAGSGSLTASSINDLDPLGGNTIDPATDLLMILDGSTLRKVNPNQLGITSALPNPLPVSVVTGLPPFTSSDTVVADDRLIIYDRSANQLKQVHPSNLGITASGGGTGTDFFRNLKYDYSGAEANPTAMFTNRVLATSTTPYVRPKFIFPHGIELSRVGKLFFDVALRTSVIEGTGSLVTRYIQDGTERSLQTKYEHVMSFMINNGQALALSSWSDGSVSNPPTDSVVEIFGIKKPLLKLVDTKDYTLTANSGDVDIGSIYFDARVPKTTGATPTYDQVTLVEMKAQAEHEPTTYQTWSPYVTYSRNDRVTYNRTSYFCNVSRTSANGNASRTPASETRIWRSFTSRGLHRGKLEFVLRNTNLSTLGTADDTFQPIVSMDYDHGVYIDNHLTTKSESITSLNGSVNLGLNTGIINIIGPARLYNAHTPSGSSLIGGMIWYDGSNFQFREGSTTRTLGSGGSATLDADTITSLPTFSSSHTVTSDDRLIIYDESADRLEQIHPSNLGISGGGLSGLTSSGTALTSTGATRTYTLGSLAKYFKQLYVHQITMSGAFVSGGTISGGAASFGDVTCRDLTASRDLSVGDDLTVTDDADIGGDLDVDGDVTVGDDLEVDGDINHDGTRVGFRGKSPQTGEEWTRYRTDAVSFSVFRNAPLVSAGFNATNWTFFLRAFRTLVRDLQQQGILTGSGV